MHEFTDSICDECVLDKAECDEPEEKMPLIEDQENVPYPKSNEENE